MTPKRGSIHHIPTDVGHFDVVQIAATCDDCESMQFVVKQIASTSAGWLLGQDNMIDLATDRDRWYPQASVGRAFDESVPHPIAAAADEAYRCASISAYRGALALARAVIEAIAKDKGITSGRLVDKIDAMRDQGLIRPAVAEMAHEIRHIGNDAAHGDFVEPVVEEEALEALELMAEVINEVYESIARMERIREARLAKIAAAKD